MVISFPVTVIKYGDKIKEHTIYLDSKFKGAVCHGREVIVEGV